MFMQDAFFLKYLNFISAKSTYLINQLLLIALERDIRRNLLHNWSVMRLVN